MKTRTILFALAATAFSAALPTSDPSTTADLASTNATVLISDLEARGARSMKGKCIASKDGRSKACKVPGGVHEGYDCRNSNCNGKIGERCVIAADEKGRQVAKCPNNELPYDWDWPWKAPKV